MAVYVRYAHKVEKLTFDLAQARENVQIAADAVAVTILAKPAANFTLKFVFYDGTSLELNQDEVAAGDSFKWDISRLYLSNTAQPGYTLKLLVEYQVAPEK